MTTPFGHPMREHFLFDANFKNLNHGSFGTYPRAVQTALHEHQHASEARPDHFYRIARAQGIDASRRMVAELLNIPVNECVFVKNATTGVGTVLRNLAFQTGDAVVYFDTIYGAVEKGLHSLMESSPVAARKVEYELPIRHEELVRRFRDVVRRARDEGLNVRVAVFDTIVSMPGVRFPFEALVRVCREEHILSLVDGAHGIGHIPLDLGALQPDFFTSNLHKWLFVPRGCAVLHVPLRNQHLIRTTLPTSWGYIPPGQVTTTTTTQGKSAFEYLFEHVATTDDTPWLCVPAALQFRREVCGGEDRIYAYLEALGRSAADIVARALGTEVMQEPGLQEGEVSQLRRCGLSTVRLPIAVAAGDAANATAVTRVSAGEDGTSYLRIHSSLVSTVGTWFRDTLFDQYNTFVPVFQHGGWLWTRLSAQVYLEESDFEWLAGVLKECCERVETEAGLSAKL
ncbi:aminotransferase family protein (LolT) [Aspergillus bombycis]|uniref:Aminotransferase family protein (LolT) n=1 Tax=Aspergillus bombycis TaxID=109264 RepID=A0A1F7ZNI4_9EURO|nr:aminotransferase family protein (LolT) [Aspergillus bombycis]OGM40688.1 aminotransferase family protein (LolT) [Aspergillus bombycis]